MDGLLIVFWGILWILTGFFGGDFGAYCSRTLTVIFGIVLVIIGCALYKQPDYFLPEGPTAMDVYKGKTRLEIHYTDSIPTDSIVVFLDEYKE